MRGVLSMQFLRSEKAVGTDPVKPFCITEQITTYHYWNDCYVSLHCLASSQCTICTHGSSILNTIFPWLSLWICDKLIYQKVTFHVWFIASCQTCVLHCSSKQTCAKIFDVLWKLLASPKNVFIAEKAGARIKTIQRWYYALPQQQKGCIWNNCCFRQYLFQRVAILETYW